MGRRLLLPPVYLLISIILMVILHCFLPIRCVIPVPFNAMGGLILALGLVLNIWSSGLFKRARTTIIPFQQSSSLVTFGPYQFSRNPMYLGMVLLFGGLAVLLGTVTPVLVVPVLVCIIATKFIAAEEQAMDATFGEAYQAYKQRVRRWI